VDTTRALEYFGSISLQSAAIRHDHPRLLTMRHKQWFNRTICVTWWLIVHYRLCLHDWTFKW